MTAIVSLLSVFYLRFM